MFHWHQVWKHMRMITNKDIEKRAIWELIDYFENQIDAVIKQSLIELNKLNELKQIQGLDPKARIDRDCIRNAIKTINSDYYSAMPEDIGGVIKREEKNEKHSQNLNVLTEVIK